MRASGREAIRATSTTQRRRRGTVGHASASMGWRKSHHTRGARSGRQPFLERRWRSRAIPRFHRARVPMLSAFEKFGVRYLVIGGHAVGLHARPRSTKALDLWLDRARPNIAKACLALAEFGVPASIIDALRTATADEIVWMGRAPARVDFLQTIPGATFDVAWKRRVDVVAGTFVVRVIGRDDLLSNNRAVARPQDLRDVRAIERAEQRSEAPEVASPARNSVQRVPVPTISNEQPLPASVTSLPAALIVRC